MPPTFWAARDTPCCFAAGPDRRRAISFWRSGLRRSPAWELKRGQAGSHRDRVAGQRAGLIDRPSGRSFHDFAPCRRSAEGMPPPNDLAEVDRIGRDAEQALGALRPTRKPVITSSKISTAPFRGQLAHRFEEFGVGAIRFMLPTTGSTMTAAMRSPCLARRRPVPAAGRCKPTPWGVLGEVGWHAAGRRVAEGQAPEPALTSRLSAAVIAALELISTSRPVYPRARRMALIVASVPEEPGAPCPWTAPGSQQVGDLDFLLGRAPKDRPSTTAASDGGDHIRMAWPRIIGPQEPT